MRLGQYYLLHGINWFWKIKWIWEEISRLFNKAGRRGNIYEDDRACAYATHAANRCDAAQ